MHTQKSLNQLLAFLNLYQHAKISVSSISSFLDTVSFRVPSRNWPLPFLTMLTPNFQSSFNLCEFMPACKKSVNPINSFWRYSHFRVHRPDWSHPLFTMPNQKMFDQLLIFVNLYQHAKNYTVSSICVGEMVDLIILESDWLRPFWPISQEQDFSQIYDL